LRQLVSCFGIKSPAQQSDREFILGIRMDQKDTQLVEPFYCEVGEAYRRLHATLTVPLAAARAQLEAERKAALDRVLCPHTRAAPPRPDSTITVELPKDVYVVVRALAVQAEVLRPHQAVNGELQITDARLVRRCSETVLIVREAKTPHS
jgi:hypothetical protein